MKKLFIALCLCSSIAANAQDENDSKNHGFKKENFFTGGSLIASFYSGGSVLGLSPTFGYSINKIIDAGVTANFTYTGERAYSGDKYRQYVYGPGAFARIYPIKMLFVQGLYEHNFIAQTYKPAYNGPVEKYKLQSNSFLVGGGYCNGREGVGDVFFYLSIMVDVIKDINSPYVEVLQDGSLRAQPIFRAGIQVPLFQGDGRRGSRRKD